MPIQIDLSPENLAKAEAEACRRQQHNEAKGLKGRNRAQATGDGALALHRLGCVGEVAVAAFLGLEGSVFSEQEAIRGSCDLPGNIEVKTRPKHGRDLLVQLDDNPDKIFVLVTHDGTTQIAGWIRGKDAMLKQYVRELVKGRPCHVVPQKALQPAETLKDAIGSPGDAGRTLGSHEVWTTELDNGDVILNFSDDLIAQLGWKVGDMLEWDVQENPGQCLIRKVNEHSKV
jgi:hypothetical protein